MGFMKPWVWSPNITKKHRQSHKTKQNSLHINYIQMKTFVKCQCLLISTHSRVVVFPLNVLNLFMFCKECHSYVLSPSRFMNYCRMFMWLPSSAQEVISVQKRDSIICGGQVSNGWRQPRVYSQPNWKMSSQLLPLPSPHRGRVERGKILRFGIHHHWAHSQFILEKWPSEVRLRLGPPIAGFQHLVSGGSLCSWCVHHIPVR